MQHAREKKNTHNILVDKTKKSDHVEAIRVEAITVLKLIFKSFMGGLVPAAGSCGDCNEYSGTVICWVYPDQLSNYQLLKKDPSPWS